MYDILIKNARIIDGTGAPWYRSDLAIQDGKIAEIGRLGSCLAKTSVDAEDLYLCPGFIDIHSHSDTSLPLFPQAESRILQGVTTEIGGDCGLSAAPVSADPARKKLLKDYVGDLPYTWNSMGEFLSFVEGCRPSVNFGMSAGHGTIRLCVMGFEARKASAEELTKMKHLLRQCLEDGAFCLSSGLIYPPGCYADTDELAQLATELVPYGAYYKTHMRNEGDMVVDALQEALQVCRISGAPLQINHHKVIRKSGWQVHCKTTVAMIKQARRQGLDVTADQYPYCASSTSLDSNVPLWAFEGGTEALIQRLQDPVQRRKIKEETNQSHEGRWGDIFVSYAESEQNQWAVGKSIEQIAQIRDCDPADACFDLIIEERGRVNEINYGMCEEDITYIMKQPFTMIGSDGQAFPMDYPGQPHPRSYGTFPRVLSHYCKELHLFPLETAVHKMTGLPAARLKLQDRGLIRQGMWADLVIFDFDSLRDAPTYSNPKQSCPGIRQVYVNGILTADSGVHTGAAAGRILKRK